MSTILTRWEEDLRYKLLTILGWKTGLIGRKNTIDSLVGNSLLLRIRSTETTVIGKKALVSNPQPQKRSRWLVLLLSFLAPFDLLRRRKARYHLKTSWRGDRSICGVAKSFPGVKCKQSCYMSEPIW